MLIGKIVMLYSYIDYNLRRMIEVLDHANTLPPAWSGRTANHDTRPILRGMIDKVRHLVKVTHDPATPRVVAGAPAPDEAADVQLLRDLICNANGISLEPYDKPALNRGKTPDFKLIDGELVGYREVKSLFDPTFWRSAGGCHGCPEEPAVLPQAGLDVRGAVEQLDAENLAHDKPNVMVFVSHTPEIERKDLIATIAGLPLADGKRLFMLGRMQGQVCGAARKSTCFCDRRDHRHLPHLTVADAEHRATALGMFGLA